MLNYNVHMDFDGDCREVFGCMMDMSKAFDLIMHSLLFKKLLDAGLTVIFIRLLIFIYVNQFANVYWDGCFSTIFRLTNGVRQGAFLSAILYCFYVNNLYKISSHYFGILGYSDDSFFVSAIFGFTARNAKYLRRIRRNS